MNQDFNFEPDTQAAKGTLRQRFVLWMKRLVPSEWWERIWWLMPAATLALIPIGTPMLHLIGLFGWRGVGRATQGLILLAVSSGLVVGSIVLWSVREADLKQRIYRRALWLARLALVGPLLTVLFLFWITRIAG